MVKKLSDICLSVFVTNLDKVSNHAKSLPMILKEEILKRISDHDLFTPFYFNFIEKCLLVNNLRHLNLYKNNQVKDYMLKSIGNQCQELKSIKINDCSQVTDTGVWDLLSSQTELEELKINHMGHNFTGKSLCTFACSKLTNINFKKCNGLKTEYFVQFLEKNAQISNIDISQTMLQTSVLEFIGKYQNWNLRSLKGLPHTAVDDEIITLLKQCPHLQILSPNGGSQLTGEFMIQVSQNCTKLESLDLSYCYKLGNRPSCESLWTIPTTVQELSLCGVMINDENILVECLQRLKNLRSVRLCGIPALNDITFPKIMKDLGQRLEVLDISGTTNLTDEGLKAIPDFCYNLSQILFSMCRQMTCKPLLQLLNDPERAYKITKVQACSRQMMDNSTLYAIAEKCPNLEFIDMAGLSDVTDDLLMIFARCCANLKFIGVKGCVNLTDIGICEIARLCPMKCMVLSGIRNLTDKSIFMIANHCHNLDEIYLNGCSNVSAVAVRYLVDSCIPRVYFQHKNPNIDSDHMMGKNLDTGEYCNMQSVLEEVTRQQELQKLHN